MQREEAEKRLPSLWKRRPGQWNVRTLKDAEEEEKEKWRRLGARKCVGLLMAPIRVPSWHPTETSGVTKQELRTRGEEPWQEGRVTGQGIRSLAPLYL